MLCLQPASHGRLDYNLHCDSDNARHLNDNHQEKNQLVGGARAEREELCGWTISLGLNAILPTSLEL